MGRDKALLPFRDSTLLGNALSVARTVTPDVHVLSGPSRRYEDFGAPVVTDEVCGAGPIAGLHTALLSSSLDRVERVFWLAVDVPFVPASTLRDLVTHLEGTDVAIARTERGVEPLCAAFRVEPCLAAVKRALASGRLKLTDALAGLSIREVPQDAALFANVNTVDEFERLTRSESPA